MVFTNLNMVTHYSSKPWYSFGKKRVLISTLLFSIATPLFLHTICDGCITTEGILTRIGPRHPSFFVQDDKSKIPCHRKDHSLFRDHGRSVYSNVNVWISMTSFSNDIQSIIQSSNLLCNEYKLDTIFECFIHCLVTSQPDAWVKVTQFFLYYM